MPVLNLAGDFAERATAPPTYRMRRHVLWYGLAAGLLIALLRLVEYRWLVLTHSFEIYGALLAVIFAAVGIWVGLRLTTPRVVVEERVVVREIPGEVTGRSAGLPPQADFSRDDDQVAALGVTPRELEILGLLAEGLSNREIAERLYVSENTVKTHASRLFEKLEVRRRTQAVQRGQQLRLIP